MIVVIVTQGYGTPLVVTQGYGLGPDGQRGCVHARDRARWGLVVSDRPAMCLRVSDRVRWEVTVYDEAC